MFGASMEALQGRRDQIRVQLAGLGDMRPGTLVPRFRKCGKPNCHCNREGSPGHGPIWTLTWKSGKKTVARIVPPGAAVERTKAQIAEFRRFHELARELIEINQQICNAQLEELKAGAQAAAKKGAPGQSSSRKPPRRSPPS